MSTRTAAALLPMVLALGAVGAVAPGTAVAGSGDAYAAGAKSVAARMGCTDFSWIHRPGTATAPGVYSVGKCMVAHRRLVVATHRTPRAADRFNRALRHELDTERGPGTFWWARAAGVTTWNPLFFTRRMAAEAQRRLDGRLASWTNKG